MDILDLEFFVEVQYDIFKILSPKNISRSLPSRDSSWWKIEVSKNGTSKNDMSFLDMLRNNESVFDVSFFRRGDSMTYISI